MRAFKALDALHAANPITLLVHGNAKGADHCAKLWAEKNHVPQAKHDAAWEDLSHPTAIPRQRPDGTPYDATAGIRRNQGMLDAHPDIELVLAFPGERGTADMCRRARQKGIAIQHEVRV
jgi:hypothetical protein